MRRPSSSASPSACAARRRSGAGCDGHGRRPLSADAAANSQSRVIVVGGGITGLAAAFRLQRTAPHLRITLLESAGRLGGKIVTERAGDFLIEGGPDSFLSTKPRGVDLCRELGLASDLCGVSGAPRRAFVLRRGELHELPEGISGLVPSRLAPLLRSRLLSPAGKVRAALECLVPRRRAGTDESLASFVRRRLGDEVYERIVEPLLGGIYGGDGAELSLEATFPALREMELRHGGLLRAWARRKEPGAVPGFLTLTGGLGDLIEALRTALRGAEILLRTRVRAVRRVRPGYTLELDGGERLEAGAVILALPATAAADLLDRLDGPLAAALRAIPHASAATVSLAYEAAAVPRPLDGTGYVVPAGEGRAVLACTWVSSKFPHRAPPGKVLVRIFLGRPGAEALLEQPDDALLGLARAETRELLGVTAEPVVSRVFRWPRGMPQYTLGHADRLAAIERRLQAHPGLRLAGNAYRGVGIPDCIVSGEQAAERIREWLA